MNGLNGMAYGFGPDPDGKWLVWWEVDGIRLSMGPFDTFKEAQTFGFHFHDVRAEGWTNVDKMITEAKKLEALHKKLNAPVEATTP